MKIFHGPAMIRRDSAQAVFLTRWTSLLLLLLVTCVVPGIYAQEVVIPDPGLNAVVRETLQKPMGPLTEQDMLTLTNLSAIFRNIASGQGLETARNLVSLDLQDNQITSLDFLTNLAHLAFLDLSENRFSQFALPDSLTNLAALRIENGRLASLSLSAGLSKLTSLRLGFNQLSNLVLPADMTNLSILSVFQNQLKNLSLPPRLPNLTQLNLAGNQLGSLELPASMTKLSALIASGNQLTNFIVPPELTGLSVLRLDDNRLTNLALPSGMTNLGAMFLRSNQLATLALPPELTGLVQIDASWNQLTSLFLPADMTRLLTLGLEGNPLDILVMTEPLAATNLAATVALLRNEGVEVFSYSLSPRLFQARQSHDAFQFSLAGPPGDYTILATEDLQTWSPVRTIKNRFGIIGFTDVPTPFPVRRFYRAQRQIPPTNMVFISPNTFTMGSAVGESGRQSNEGPQTVVTLTRGFWIGKYEVTQGEYLSVTGTNPSQFPGDLSRPVSSVSWPDATNYCAMLTQRELLAGRISAGSRYRLPTEAEWECAARAGTTTRFSYGDDPDYSNLPNYAWQSVDDGLTVHPVGQKLPNPWGLHDMMGNVLEWCQDWLGPLPGGSVTDPQGPASNQIGWKVMRGGAFDTGGAACRSASRMFFGNHPALTDWNLGFRVVLVTEP